MCTVPCNTSCLQDIFLQCGSSRKEFKIKSFGKCKCVQRKCNLELIKKLEQMEMKGKQTVQSVTKAHEEQPCKSICRKCQTVTSIASNLSRIKNQESNKRTIAFLPI